MSEPTLYRDTTDNYDDKEMVAYLVTHEALVPVERCEHGNIDPHIVFYTDGTPWHGCPGAGIGGDDES